MSLKMINGNEIMDNLNDDITVINFYAEWCGPCKMMTPIFEEMGNDGMNVLKINIDENKDAAMEFGVQGIPATFIFKNKEKKLFETGYIAKDALMEKIKAL